MNKINIKYEQPNSSNVKKGDLIIKKCDVRGIRILDITEVRDNSIITGIGITSELHFYNKAIIKSNSSFLVGEDADQSLIEKAVEYFNSRK